MRPGLPLAILLLLCMATQLHATSWSCPEDRPNCPAPLALRMIGLGFFEATFLAASLPALSDRRALREGQGQALTFVGAAYLASTPFGLFGDDRRSYVAGGLLGGTLVGVGLYDWFWGHDDSKTTRFLVNFAGMNAGLGLIILLPVTGL
jgi:hypothetical protein